MHKIIIKDDTWKFYIFDSDEYVAKFGDHTSGFTDRKNKQVFFNAEDLDLQLVKHELFHVFASYLHIDATELDNDQLEEIYAEMYSHDGHKMEKLASSTFKILRGLE